MICFSSEVKNSLIEEMIQTNKNYIRLTYSDT